jgi:hypothetical protein
MEVVQMRKRQDARRRRRRKLKTERAGKRVPEVKDDEGVLAALLFIAEKKLNAPGVRGGVGIARGGAGKGIRAQVAPRNERGKTLGRRAKKSAPNAIPKRIGMTLGMARAQESERVRKIKTLRMNSPPCAGEHDLLNPPGGDLAKDTRHSARIPTRRMLGERGRRTGRHPQSATPVRPPGTRLKRVKRSLKPGKKRIRRPIARNEEVCHHSGASRAADKLPARQEKRRRRRHVPARNPVKRAGGKKMRTRKRRPDIPQRMAPGKKRIRSVPHFPKATGTAKTPTPDRANTSKGNPRPRVPNVGMTRIPRTHEEETLKGIGKNSGAETAHAQEPQ